MDMPARLGAACRNARETADRSLMDIANRAGVSQTTIHNFEAAKGGVFRRDSDRIVHAYAVETGVPWRELWQRALDE